MSLPFFSPLPQTCRNFRHRIATQAPLPGLLGLLLSDLPFYSLVFLLFHPVASPQISSPLPFHLFLSEGTFLFLLSQSLFCVQSPRACNGIHSSRPCTVLTFSLCFHPRLSILCLVVMYIASPSPPSPIIMTGCQL